MDNKKIDELKPLLDIMQQPAFTARDYAVTYQNLAFRELCSITGVTAEAFINAPASLLGQTDERVVLAGGRGYNVSELTLEDGMLYVLKSDSSYETANFLARIVSVQRTSLQAIFAFGVKSIERNDAKTDERTSIENSVFLHGVYRMTRTLNNMDLYQQLVNGRRRLHTKSVPLGTYFSELSEKAKKLLQQAKLTLKTTLPQDNPLVWMDEELVEVAVWNLLANAGENAPDKVINLRVSYSGRLVIEVGNTGELPDNRRVFDKKKIPLEEDFGTGGLGIGIPLLQEITRLHGGGLILESTQEGTRLAASFATEIIGNPTVRSDRLTIKASTEMDRGLIGLSELLPTSSYLPEDILG